jgi:hypothetical protein
LRAEGGRLKLGYGPGGPPVLDKETIKSLIQTLKKIDYFSEKDIRDLMKEK